MKFVQASVTVNWRRWVAMLCIALLAFVVIEEASPAHAATDIPAISFMLDAGDNAGAALTQSSADQQLPQPPTQPPHHCCAAHTCSVALAPNSGTSLTQVPVHMDAQRETPAALSSATDGLERPPKVFTIS